MQRKHNSRAAKQQTLWEKKQAIAARDLDKEQACLRSIGLNGINLPLQSLDYSSPAGFFTGLLLCTTPALLLLNSVSGEATSTIEIIENETTNTVFQSTNATHVQNKAAEVKKPSSPIPSARCWNPTNSLVARRHPLDPTIIKKAITSSTDITESDFNELNKYINFIEPTGIFSEEERQNLEKLKRTICEKLPTALPHDVFKKVLLSQQLEIHLISRDEMNKNYYHAQAYVELDFYRIYLAADASIDRVLPLLINEMHSLAIYLRNLERFTTLSYPTMGYGMFFTNEQAHLVPAKLNSLKNYLNLGIDRLRQAVEIDPLFVRKMLVDYGPLQVFGVVNHKNFEGSYKKVKKNIYQNIHNPDHRLKILSKIKKSNGDLDLSYQSLNKRIPKEKQLINELNSYLEIYKDNNEAVYWAEIASFIDQFPQDIKVVYFPEFCQLMADFHQIKSYCSPNHSS